MGVSPYGSRRDRSDTESEDGRSSAVSVESNEDRVRGQLRRCDAGLAALREYDARFRQVLNISGRHNNDRQPAFSDERPLSSVRQRAGNQRAGAVKRVAVKFDDVYV